MSVNAIESPLRIGWPRLRLWAIGLFLIGLAPVIGAFVYDFHDWPAFWSAGATVGTADLVPAEAHIAWQRARDLPAAFWPYPAGTAWLFAPLAAMPLGASFVVWGAVMLACAAAAGVVGARTFGLDRTVGILAVLAFAPVTASIVIGQNGPLGVLLAMVAIAALAAERTIVPGLAVGALLFKPTWGLPLAGLLLLRRRWASLAIVGLAILGWYLVGVAAAAGDLGWPMAWLAGLADYIAADYAANADKAASLPGLVARLPVPPWVPIAVAVLLVAVAIPRLIRAPIAEAGAGACLVGVAASPHAWGYDAALIVPWLLWAMSDRGLAEPWKTRIIVATYLAGPLWLFSRQTGVSVISIVVLGLTIVWLSGRWRIDGGQGTLQPGDEASARTAAVP
jgi:hypothetical protein